MLTRIALLTALVATLLTAGCGEEDPAPDAAPSNADVTDAATTRPAATAEDAVLAWLRDPDLGMELSPAMARCEAREILASGLPDSFLARLAEDGFVPTEDETDQFLAAVGEAEQTCVAELPDDPAAP